MKISNTYAPAVYNTSQATGDQDTCVMYVLTERRPDVFAVYMGVTSVRDMDSESREAVASRIACSGLKINRKHASCMFPFLSDEENVTYANCVQLLGGV